MIEFRVSVCVYETYLQILFNPCDVVMIDVGSFSLPNDVNLSKHLTISF